MGEEALICLLLDGEALLIDKLAQETFLFLLETLAFYYLLENLDESCSIRCVSLSIRIALRGLT